MPQRYLVSFQPQSVPDDDAAEGTTSHSRGYTRDARDPRDDRDGDRRPGDRKKLSKEQKKAQRGANKGRRFGKIRDDLELCWRVANGTACEFGSECVWISCPRKNLAVLTPNLQDAASHTTWRRILPPNQRIFASQRHLNFQNRLRSVLISHILSMPSPSIHH